MSKKTLTLAWLMLGCYALIAQNGLTLPTKKLEYQLAYFGEFFAHPGVKLGASYPFFQKVKTKEKQKKKYELVKTKVHQWRVGSNLAFYHQVDNHNGYLWNVELTYRRSKNKSKKSNKWKHFEASYGLGFYHYELLGKTFQTADSGFEEINGNGNAFLQSIAIAWGKNIRLIKAADVRYYFKPTLYLETPAGTGTQARFVMEIGLATSLK